MIARTMRRRPKRTHSSLPTMLATMATRPLAVAAAVGETSAVSASPVRASAKASSATSHDLRVNSSQQWAP